MFNGKTPSVDIINREYEVLVRAEIPGVDNRGIEISITDNRISIKGIVKHDMGQEKADNNPRETASENYARTYYYHVKLKAAKQRSSFWRACWR